jgi:hypothetical protein
MNPNDAGIGSIVIGLLLVLAGAAAIYMFGMLIVSRFRAGRVNEETDITYPDNPQSDADRRAVETVHQNERVGADNATDMELHEQAVGEPIRPVRQSPTQRERPADADYTPGVAPSRRAGDQDGERSPL